MPYIKVNKQINIKRARTKVQRCLYCGKQMDGALGIIFGNKGDGLAMKKTLWIHFSCAKQFGKLMINTGNLPKEKIVALAI